MRVFLADVLIIIVVVCSASDRPTGVVVSAHNISGGTPLGPHRVAVVDAHPKKLSKSAVEAATAVSNRPTITPVGSAGANSQEDMEEHSSEDEIQWECGTDEFSKFIAESTIDRDCPQLKESVNNCCLEHDKCYDDQLGRTYCDDTFCACLDTATASSRKCADEDAPTFCGLVREFGEDPYVQAGLLRSAAPNVTDIVLTANINNTDNALN